MFLSGVLVSDIKRITSEEHVSFFFLVTGGRGSGKSVALGMLLQNLLKDDEAVEVDSFLNCCEPWGEDCANNRKLRVCMMNYTKLRSAAHLVGSTSDCVCSTLPAHTVLILDDIEAIWTLSSFNGELAFLKSSLSSVLRSPGCALVSSAVDVNSVPLYFLERHRPILYPLPDISPDVSFTRFFPTLDCQSNHDEVAKDLFHLVPNLNHRDLQACLCMVKLDFEENERGYHLACNETMRGTLQQRLHWLMGLPKDHEPSLMDTLYGLSNVQERLSMLISVFASSSTINTSGKLLTSMPSTTGILLHGSSGCGKSALLRRVASAFPSVTFFFVECTALFCKYLGESEEKLREFYRKARCRLLSVVVLENVDVIAQSRGTMHGSGTSDGKGDVDINRRMLAGLLCELDGVTDNSGVLTIGTTNAPWVIDSALLRQGRLESVLYVPFLTLSAAHDMCYDFFHHFVGEHLEKEACSERIAQAAEGCAPTTLRAILRKLMEQTLSARVPLVGDLVFPSKEVVEHVLFENASMLKRVQYRFDRF